MFFSCRAMLLVFLCCVVRRCVGMVAACVARVVVAALARVETQVGELPASLAAVVDKRASAQTASISGVLEATKGSIIKELASATQNAQKLAASAKGLQWAVLALITINCAISLWAGLR